MLPKTRRSLVALALSIGAPVHFAAVTLAPRVALADDDYKLHMENGIKLFQEKNYGAALAEFRAAYDAKPKASPLLNMALCYKAQFNYPKAIQMLEKALKDHPDTMDAPDTKAAQDAIAEMRGVLAYLTLHLSPPKATVTVDGEEQPAGAASSPIPLGPGKHKIGARLDGYETGEVEITAVSGQRLTSELNLPPNKGWLMIQYPGMTFGLDGKYIGHDQFGGMVAPGRHELLIYTSARAFDPFQIQVVVGQSILVQAGPRGQPIISGLPVAQQPAARPTPPVPPQSPRATPEAPQPQKRGFYVLGGASLLWPTGTLSVPDRKANGDPTGSDISFSKNSGFAVQLMGGYRVNNVAGFELFFEYMNIFTPNSSNSNQGYTESTERIGPALRLMTPGKTVRLAGTLAGGIAADGIDYTGFTPTNPTSQSSVAGFVLADAGLELDLSGVLIDALVEGSLQTSRPNAAGSSSNGNQPVGFGGFGLRVGYAFWH